MIQTILKNVIPYGANPISVVLPAASTFLGVTAEKGFVTVYVSAPSATPSDTFVFDLMGIGDTFDDEIPREFLGIARTCCFSWMVFRRTE